MTMKVRGFSVPITFERLAPHREAAERLYQFAVRAIRRFIIAAGWDITVYGTEHVPADGPALIAGNHTGYPDFALMGVGPHLRGERLVRFMAKQSVFEVPVLGSLLRTMHHVPVDRARGGTAVDAAVRVLGEGQLVGIFPEGTISRSFELSHFKTGAARIAHQADVPLIPCVIWGSQRVWTKDLPKRWRKVPIIIRYGEPVTLTGDADADTAELKRQMQILLEESRAEYAARYGDGAGEAWMPVALGGTAPTIEEADELYARERAERDAKKARRKRRKH